MTRTEIERLRTENANLGRLAWSVREWLVLRRHKDAAILVETIAQVERNIEQAIAMHFGAARRACPYDEEETNG